MLMHPWNWKYRAFLFTLPKQLICCLTLTNEPNNISNAINYLNSTDFIRVILYGNKNVDDVTNFKIITATIKIIKITKRFEEDFFQTTDLLKIWNNVDGEYRQYFFMLNERPCQIIIKLTILYKHCALIWSFIYFVQFNF